MTAKRKLKIMFLCTANSCRSQMAEGFAQHYGKGLVEVHSAGLFEAAVQPRAIAVMRELGIDISGQRSKVIDEELLKKMDIIITLCSNAEVFCPRTPAEIKRIYWPVKDPVGTVGTEEEILKEFRRSRDEIEAKIRDFINGIKKDVTL